MVNNILITTECVADMPSYIYKNKDVEIIYFDVETENGQFRDTVEINSQNVVEYMLGGEKKAHSIVPSPNDFKKFFANGLKEYDEIIHICISDKSSDSYGNSNMARAKMGADGNKIHIIDSKSLSGGQALVVLEAMKCRDNGMKCEQIVEHLNEFVSKVSTTFLANSADYLYYNGKVSKKVMQICRFFRLHPVLAMVDGKMTVTKIYIGDYRKAAKKYIKRALGNGSNVKKDTGFLILSGCDLETTQLARENVAKRVKFDNLYENQASATVSSNCGPYTFGILYVKEN